MVGRCGAHRPNGISSRSRPSQRRPLAAGQSTAALLAKYLAHRDFVGLKGDSFGGCNNKKYATKEAIFSAVAISTICR
jgi:hypothetical protein